MILLILYQHPLVKEMEVQIFDETLTDFFHYPHLPQLDYSLFP